MEQEKRINLNSKLKIDLLKQDDCLENILAKRNQSKMMKSPSMVTLKLPNGNKLNSGAQSTGDNKEQGGSAIESLKKEKWKKTTDEIENITIQRKQKEGEAILKFDKEITKYQNLIIECQALAKEKKGGGMLNLYLKLLEKLRENKENEIKKITDEFNKLRNAKLADINKWYETEKNKIRGLTLKSSDSVAHLTINLDSSSEQTKTSPLSKNTTQNHRPAVKFNPPLKNSPAANRFKTGNKTMFV
jgi:hypothetical protein